jgi:hypothetical protein
MCRQCSGFGDTGSSFSAAGKYAKFWLAPVSLAQSVGYNARELTRLRVMVERRHQFFREKWNEFFQA